MPRDARTRESSGPGHRLSSFGWKLVPLAPIVVVGIAATLARFARIIHPYLAIDYDLRFELGMVVGQILFQWVVLAKKSWADRLECAVVLLAVSALGAALLWPLLAYHAVSAVTPRVAVGYFFAVVGVMFVAHWRLVVRARLPVHLCLTWVVYRLLLLAIVVRWR